MHLYEFKKKSPLSYQGDFFILGLTYNYLIKMLKSKISYHLQNEYRLHLHTVKTILRNE